MKKINTLAAALCIILLMACGGPTPVPDDKKEYCGLWEAEDYSLEIDCRGTVAYEKGESGSAKTTINGNISEWQGDNFLVGALGFNAEFVVTEPPHEEDGFWMMTVDGVEVMRQ